MPQPHETASTAAPALPEAFKDQQAHDALLQEWLDWTGSLISLAHEHDLTLDQFIAWFHLEQTQARIRTLAAIADARAFLLARLHRAAAIERLAEITESTREANIRDRIRSATQILRTAQIADKRDKAAIRSDALKQRTPPSEDAPHSGARGATPRPDATPAASSRDVQPYTLMPEGGTDSPVGGSSPGSANAPPPPHAASHPRRHARTAPEQIDRARPSPTADQHRWNVDLEHRPAPSA